MRIGKFLWCGLGLAWTGQALAGHGTGVVGFGAESLGMAGTDIAVARDSAAVNINPAGLTQIENRRFDAYFSPFHTGRMRHSDERGNRQLNDNPMGAPIAGSYAVRLSSYPKLVIGGGLFMQGGTGMVYEDMKTPFGTEDDLSAIIGISKLVVGAGWAVNDRLSLGANLGLFAGLARQKFFPNTSDADANFPGLRMDDGFGTATNFSLGLQYRITPELKFALAYTDKVEIAFKDANVTMNYEAWNLGRVKYRDARLDGVALPSVVSVGLAWQARRDLLIAIEYELLNQSAALQGTRLRASDPDGPVLPDKETLDIRNTLGWRDQQVYSIGTAWQYSDKLTLRAGYDYINNPVPARHTSPLFNIAQGGEVTAGFSRAFGTGWSFDFATQYQFKRTFNYTNPELPFGRSREVFECISFTAAISRHW